MNLTSFNQIMVLPFFRQEQRAEKVSIIAAWPLFLMEGGADLSAETMVNLKSARLTEMMPFPGVRLYHRTDNGRQVNEWIMLLFTPTDRPEEIHVHASCYSVREIKTGQKRVEASPKGVSFIVHDRLDIKRAFFVNGQRMKEDEFHSLEALEQYSLAASYVVCSFFASLMNPHLHRAMVRPNKCGKSVEWLRQRTHFVFIHKSHKANQAGFTGKADLERDHIERMAHSRRAHDRILRHPRFKNKVGLKIRVKACWVGPKEWEGNSGQIYRIIE
jgi:hypothetical protein